MEAYTGILIMGKVEIDMTFSGYLILFTQMFNKFSARFHKTLSKLLNLTGCQGNKKDELSKKCFKKSSSRTMRWIK